MTFIDAKVYYKFLSTIFVICILCFGSYYQNMTGYIP